MVNVFCCCSKRREYDEDDDEIELSANNCKIGLISEGMTITPKRTNEEGAYVVNGKGIAMGSCPLECDTAYWEVMLGKNPENVKIGVVRFDPKTDKKPTPISKDKWQLEDDSLKEGDVVGIHWDQTDLPMLSFTKNGDRITSSVNRIRPSNNIYAAVELASANASATLVFDGRFFDFEPLASKFGAIVSATNII